MSADTGPAVQELLPTHTWDRLEKDPEAVLIDVRTKAEWCFVGKPDLSSLGRSILQIEWCEYPDMSVNPRFVEEVKKLLDGSHPSAVFFICRSGARSLNAARVVLASIDDAHDAPALFNVTEGFEGDLDAKKQRGGLNGWKARGLPWRQS